ncbi:MAG: beta strand repeat-containing protein, partial [Gemmataceae bacterium]
NFYGAIKGISSGNGNLTLTTSGAINVGNPSFTTNIGATNPVGDILIAGYNPTALNVYGSITSKSLKVDTNNNVKVLGAINITGAQNYNGDGLVLVGDSDISIGAVTTTNSSSSIKLNHFGNLKLLGNIQAAGSFDQSTLGGGVIEVGAVVANPPVIPSTIISIAANNNTLLDFDTDIRLNSNLTVQSLSNGANVTFNKSINSAVGTKAGLNVQSTGVLQFSGSLGDQVQLGAINTSNAVLSGIVANTLGTSITALSFTSGSVLGDIEIAVPQTYNGSTGLNLGTTAKNTFSNDITLGRVTTQNGGGVQFANADLLNLQDDMNLDGAFSQVGSSINAKVNFGSLNPFSINTNAKNVSLQSPVVLIQNTTVQTGGAGDITFSNIVDSTNSGGNSSLRNLTINNPSGASYFSKNVGASANSQLGSISVTSGTINLGSNAIQILTKSTNGQNYTGAIKLNANTTMDAGNAGSVVFSSTMDSGLSTSSLAITNTPAVQINGRVGSISPLSSVNISANTTTLNADQITTIGSSGQVYNTGLTIGTGVTTATLNAGTGAVDFQQTVTVGNRNLVVTGNDVIIGAGSTLTS